MLNKLKNILFFYKKYPLRNFMPKSITGRVFLMIFVPLIFSHIVITTFFYKNHWEHISKHYSLHLSYELNAITDLINTFDGEEANEWIKKFANKNLKLDLEFVNKLPNESFNTDDRIKLLQKHLTEEIGYKNYIYSDFSNKILVIYIELKPNKYIEIITSTKRIYSNTEYYFILLIITSSIIIFFFIYPFLNNQAKSIKNLATAAERFGKGKDADFKPTGALEIRQAGKAFIQMKDRIKKYIENRTEMLTGISHDLRTPLTRMKIEIELLKNKEDIEPILEDIHDMEKMIESYINFAKTDTDEKTQKQDFKDMISKIINKFSNNKKNISIYFDKEKYANQEFNANIKPTAINRSLTNIISNSMRYAYKTIRLTLEQTQKDIIITIDDDGPGIPKEKRENMFKPFVREETSRNQKTGGIGLGLTITQQIILSHGGDIELLDSPLSGLRVKITLPKN